MPRPVFDGYEDDEKEEEKAEFSTDFDSIIAKEPVKAAAPLIIDNLPNSFRRSNGYMPDVVRMQHNHANGRSIAEIDEAERVRNTAFGLTRPVATSSTNLRVTADTVQAGLPGILPDEERAMQELVDPTEIVADHTIERIAGNELFNKLNEHPDMSTLEDYEAIPVESFGLAMLRGMGYDPAVEAAKEQFKENTRRPDFLGLGATERPEDSKTSKENSLKKFEQRKAARTYVPVVKINKRTGEIVQEKADDEQVIDSRKEDVEKLALREAATHSRSIRDGESSKTNDRHSSSKSSRRDGESSHDRSSSGRSKYTDEDDRRRRHRHRSRSPRRDSDRHRSRSYRDR